MSYEHAIDFTNLDLRTYIFPQTIIGANFTGADLRGVDLSYRHIHGCIFSGAFLNDANFTNAIVSNCHFAENCTKIYSPAADLTAAVFTRARIEKSNLQNCNLTNCKFTETILINVDFKMGILN